MAVREFNIPFGPDKTGGLGFAELGIEGRSDEVRDPFADPAAEDPLQDASPAEPGLLDDPELEDIEVFEEDPLPPAAPDPSEAPQADPASEAPRSAVSGSASRRTQAPRPQEDLPEEEEEDEAPLRPHDDVQTSFIALKDSFGQSRELKAREREMDELREQLRVDGEELADRQDILERYSVIVAEQDRIVQEATAERDRAKAELASIADEMQATEAELAQMREHHDRQLQPLETDLGRARAEAEQAKNDERSRKSELNAAETELRRAGAGSDATMLEAKVDRIHEAYDRARHVSERAQGALAEVQRAYDDALAEIQQREGPLERSIKAMGEHEDDLKESIAALGEEASAARKRRQYCDAVYQYPEETEKLRRAVQSDEAMLEEMQLDYDELQDLLNQTKANARKAKLALVMGAIIVIAFVVALVVILTRS